MLHSASHNHCIAPAHDTNNLQELDLYRTQEGSIRCMFFSSLVRCFQEYQAGSVTRKMSAELFLLIDATFTSFFSFFPFSFFFKNSRLECLYPGMLYCFFNIETMLG